MLNGCKKFHYFVYGTKFIIETDHKPLIGLLKKPIENLSPRLQRMTLELFKYDFDIIHVSGKKLYIADTLSRAPMPITVETKILEQGAATVHTILTATNQKTRELREATKVDKELCLVKDYIQNGWPKSIKHLDKYIKPYWEKRSGLYYNED